MGLRWSESNATTEASITVDRQPFRISFDLKGHNWRLDEIVDGYARPRDALAGYGGNLAPATIGADVTMAFELGVQAWEGTDVSDSPLRLRVQLLTVGPTIEPIVAGPFALKNAWNALRWEFRISIDQFQLLRQAAGLTAVRVTAF